MKKLVSILCAAATLAGGMSALMAGCQKTPGAGGSTAPPPAAASQNPAAEEPVELKLIVRKLGEGAIDNPILPIIEEKVGVKLNIDFRAPSDYGQQCQVILASRDYPDMMEVWWSNPPGDFDDFGASGELLALDELIDAYGPNIKKIRPEGTWWKAADGKIYGIPCRYAEKADVTFLIRQDWLDALGLEMPKTLDDVYEAAKAFTFKDPDGNGQNDTFGIGQGKDYAHTWEMVFGAYGVQRDQWNIVDGQLVWWGVRPEALEAAKVFRKWYQEGLVEPEFPLLARSEYFNELNADKYGIFWHQPTQMTEASSDYWREFKANVPQSEISVLAPITKADGAQPSYPGINELQFINQIIFKSAKHPEKCVQLLDYLATDEGADLVTFGIEGQHWNEENGKVAMKDMTPDEIKASGSGLYAWMIRQKYYPRNTSELAMEAIDTYMPFVARNPMPYQTAPEQKYGPSLKVDYTTSTFTKLVIEKDIDVDALWNEYVNTWNTTGGREMTEAVNAEYAKISAK